jgi:hypothetical protein
MGAAPPSPSDDDQDVERLGPIARPLSQRPLKHPFDHLTPLCERCDAAFRPHEAPQSQLRLVFQLEVRSFFMQ